MFFFHLIHFIFRFLKLLFSWGSFLIHYVQPVYCHNTVFSYWNEFIP